MRTIFFDRVFNIPDCAVLLYDIHSLINCEVQDFRKSQRYIEILSSPLGKGESRPQNNTYQLSISLWLFVQSFLKINVSECELHCGNAVHLVFTNVNKQQQQQLHKYWYPVCIIWKLSLSPSYGGSTHTTFRIKKEV